MAPGQSVHDHLHRGGGALGHAVVDQSVCERRRRRGRHGGIFISRRGIKGWMGGGISGSCRSKVEVAMAQFDIV